MRRSYIKSEEVIQLLQSGWEIFTERGSAPYDPLYFHIYGNGGDRKRIHPNTIQSLIKKNIIHGTNVKHGKYTLKLQP